MPNKKIVIIGSNSFLANELIRSIDNHENVIGLYHIQKDLLNKKVMQLPISCYRDIDANTVESVYFLSAYVPNTKIEEKERSLLFEVNIKLTEEVLSHFSESKIIYCSSVSVYSNFTEINNENSCAAPLGEYGISKLWGEMIVQKCARYAIVRISSMYGIGMKLHTIIPKMIESAVLRSKITIFGDGSRLQNYVHISDVAHYLCAASLVTENGIFLATGSESLSNKDIATIISEIQGTSVEYEGIDDSPSFIYNNDITKKILNCNSKIEIKEGLKEVIEWIKKMY